MTLITLRLLPQDGGIVHQENEKEESAQMSYAVESGAQFSDCRVWRYALWRIWQPDCGVATFIGLNPSTADESVNDPTVRRCIDFARTWGFGGMRMLNIFAYRATDPKNMKLASDPVGVQNDYFLRHYVDSPDNRLTVAAWGKHGSYLDRGQIVSSTLLSGLAIKCFGRNKNGSPKHPLYMRSDIQLIDFT